MYIYERFYRQWEKEHRERRRRQSLIAVALVGIVVFVVIGFQKNIASVQLPEEHPSAEDLTSCEEASVSPVVVSSEEPETSEAPQRETETVTGTVRSGQSFYYIMTKHGFSPTAIAQMVDAFDTVFDCNKISAGDELVKLQSQERMVAKGGAGLSELLPAERNLIDNGDFQEPLLAGWEAYNIQSDPAEVEGQVSVLPLDGRRVALFSRRGAARNHAETGVTQRIEQDVRGHDGISVIVVDLVDDGAEAAAFAAETDVAAGDATVVVDPA